MRKILTLCICASLLFCACAQTSPADEKPTIVASLFPQYDFCRYIAGDNFNVELLLSPGMESHSFEPSVADAVKIANCAMFVYTGDEMEPWAAELAKNAKTVIDVSANVPLIAEHDEHDEHEDEHAGHHHEHDPHIWTSPANAKIIIDNVLLGLKEIDKANSALYEARAGELKAELDVLDSEFFALSQRHSGEVLCHGGRFALAYFADRYSLEFISAIDSCASEAEPSAKRVADMIERVRADKIKTVFYEEMTEPRIARTIAAECGAEALLLHSCHNVSLDEFSRGETYVSLMRKNLENLKKAFGEDI